MSLLGDRELKAGDEWTAWMKPTAFFEKIMEDRDAYRARFNQCCQNCCRHGCTYVNCHECGEDTIHCTERLEYPTLCSTCEHFPFKFSYHVVENDEMYISRIDDVHRRILYILGEDDLFFGKFTWDANRRVEHEIQNNGIGRWEECPEDDGWDLSDNTSNPGFYNE